MASEPQLTQTANSYCVEHFKPALRVSRHTAPISAAGVAEGPQPDRVPCTSPFYYTILYQPDRVPCTFPFYYTTLYYTSQLHTAELLSGGQRAHRAGLAQVLDDVTRALRVRNTHLG